MTTGDPERIAKSLDSLGRRQHGLVTTAQLHAMGYSHEAVHRLIGRGRIVPLRRGLYRLCGVAPTWFTAALGAVLAAGPRAALSHGSAGVLWGLLDPAAGPGGALELTSPALRRLAGVRAHRNTLETREVTVRRAIPVTTIERTLLDLADRTDAGTLGGLLDEVLRPRLTTLKKIRAVADAHGGPGRRPLQPLREALADRGAGYDPGANDWERSMDRMWDRLRLPRAERQYRIRVAGGRSFRPDRAILDARIAVDWNGYGPHGFRSGFDYDSDRRALLAGAGWYPLDFTSRSSARLICRTVLAVYHERVGRLAQGRMPD